jgi:nitric oxide reductase NorQ protein
MINYPAVFEVSKPYNKGNKVVVTYNGIDVSDMFAWATKQKAFDTGCNIYKETEHSKSKLVKDSDAILRASHPANVEGSDEFNQANLMQFLQSGEVLKSRPAHMFVQDLTWKVVVRNVMKGKNTLLVGPSGSGKTQLVYEAAKAAKREIFYVNLGATQDPRGTLIGNTHFDKDKGTFFSQSAFVSALQTENMVILLDEISRAHPEAWNILMTVLDDKQRYLRLDEAVGSPTIKVAKGVSFIGTANIGSEYTSTRVMDRALMDRFNTVEIAYLTASQEAKLVKMQHPTLDPAMATSIGEILEATRAEVKSDSSRIGTAVSTRVGLELAEMLCDGFTLAEAAELTLYPFYSEEGGLTSERTFIRQLVQRYIGAEETQEAEASF